MKPPTQAGAVRRKTGRPLSFDRDAVLEQAMLVFWRHGYETASINDLTAAMGITAPSLYAAFGDKKRLFLAAVDRYVGDREATTRMISEAPSAREAARGFLIGAAMAYTGEATPAGCLLASATASVSTASADVQRVVAEVRQGVQAHFQARIEHDVTTGALPPSTDVAGLAGLVMAVSQGMSVLARDGATRAALTAIVDATLQAWPTA